MPLDEPAREEVLLVVAAVRVFEAVTIDVTKERVMLPRVVGSEIIVSGSTVLDVRAVEGVEVDVERIVVVVTGMEDEVVEVEVVVSRSELVVVVVWTELVVLLVDGMEEVVLEVVVLVVAVFRCGTGQTKQSQRGASASGVKIAN